MKLTLRWLREITSLAKEEQWRGEIPRVDASLRLAIDALISQGIRINCPEEMLGTIQREENCWIKNIMCKNKSRTVAFAIRDAYN